MPPDTRTAIAFDTSGARCAAALITRRISGGDSVVVLDFARVDPMAKGQAEHLMPMLEAMLSSAGLVWADVDVIGVGTGPGNFTGIRISVAAARGLALGLGIPAIGVTGFEAAASWSNALYPFWALTGAPGGRVYAQAFDVVRGDPVVIAAEEASDLDGRIVRLDDMPPEDMARSIAGIALSKCTTVQPRPAPLYIRPADAAPPRDTGPVLLP